MKNIFYFRIFLFGKFLWSFHFLNSQIVPYYMYIFFVIFGLFYFFAASAVQYRYCYCCGSCFTIFAGCRDSNSRFCNRMETGVLPLSYTHPCRVLIPVPHLRYTLTAVYCTVGSELIPVRHLWCTLYSMYKVLTTVRHLWYTLTAACR